MYNQDGQFKCTPKYDRSGMIVSAFQSRQYGFGYAEFEKLKIL